MKRFVVPILSLVFAAALVTAVLVFGIYLFGWENTLPLPAAMINGDFITYRDFEKYRQAYPGIAFVSSGEILNKIVADKIAADYIAYLKKDLAERRRAEKIRQEIEHGLAFPEAAEKFSEDEISKYIGGSIGLLAQNEIDPWIKEAVEKLNVGEISEVIVSPAGYQIIELTSRNEDSGMTRLQLRQILLKGPDFDSYFEKQKQNYRVYTFGKI